MSLYNTLYGASPAVFLILPMLGKHPDAYPRFRDVFVKDAEHPEYDGKIQIYTRTGGGNREAYEAENEAMRRIPGFLADFDDSYDCTYASWVFEVPECWKADFDLIIAGRLREVSSEYQAELLRVFPKLADKLKELFV